MNPKNTALLTATLTENLTSNKQRAQVEQLKKELASTLNDQTVTDAIPKGLSLIDRLNFQTLSKTTDLAQEVSDAATTPEAVNGIASPNYSVVRRDIPVITSQVPDATPSWAAGMAVDHTLGPFVDNYGKWYWWDFYKIVTTVIVQRGTDQFLMVPFHGILTSQHQYKLNAGSIWIRSQLITPSAPAGAFTGLKIKGGILRFNDPVTISGGTTIVIGNNDICELIVDLDQPADQPANDTPTGEDARHLNIKLPEKVTINVGSGNVAVVLGTDMDLRVYQNEFALKPQKATPAYNQLLNRILVPYKNASDSNSLQISHAQSKLFLPAGKAGLQNTYWALPVTTSSITNLGDAAGTGAIVLQLNPGINATWVGLAKGPIQLNECYLLAEPGRIAITAPAATSKKAKQYFELWNESQKEKLIRSRVDLTWNQPVQLFYNCLSSGAETIKSNGQSLTASIDQPVTADHHRLNITSPSADLVLFEVKGERTVYALALNIMQQLSLAKKIGTIDPISFALRNAFFKTTPVDDFLMIGKLATPTTINQGSVILDCPLYFILPTLPDPYVTNFYLYGPSRERLSYSSSPGIGMSLAATIQWNNPTTPDLQIFFLPDSTNPQLLTAIESNVTGWSKNISSLQTDTANNNTETAQAGGETPPFSTASLTSFARRFNNTAAVYQEDAANSQQLRNRFNKELNTTNESFFLLDVSTNADLFGVGVGLSHNNDTKDFKVVSRVFPFQVKDMDLTTYAFNTRLYTLPQVQWEPLQTIQNPAISPPFPSPVTSANTGDPTIIGTASNELVPIAPIPAIAKFIAEYNKAGDPQKLVTLFSLPFGMKSVAVMDNPNDTTKQGATVALNSPDFDQQVQGGIQISMMATSPSSGADMESPGFQGATIQLRNLIDLLTGNIPVDGMGNPYSVLGPVVDIIFNGEFRPGGGDPRVPLERMDISGYGASIFSNWLNPNAVIAATSQAKFDVIVGRTSHEVIQVKSLLYPWAIPVVRTITIQRTTGGGVTRHDSGWKAQGAGLYDFSFYTPDPADATKKIFHPNPFETHPGVIKGIYNVTEISDTGRIYTDVANPADPNDDVIMQEVFFNADVLIEDVQTGAFNGYVPSKGQRGFVQLGPYQKLLTPLQYFNFLNSEGTLGGPVDCVINVGQSGQLMRCLRVDVTGVNDAGASFFVSTAKGSVYLPKEGSWSLVKTQPGSGDIITIDGDSGYPLIREGKLNTSGKKKFPPVIIKSNSKPYRFADAADLKQTSSPNSDYGILHSTGPQKVLFLRPTIKRNDANIRSTLTPFFADCYALLGSVGIFPNVNTTFPLGGGGTVLEILGSGKLKLNSGGNYLVPGGYTRDLVNKGGGRIYVDYADAAGGGGTTAVAYSFDSNASVPWSASMDKISIVTDLPSCPGITTLTTSFAAAADQKPNMGQPTIKYGSVLQPIIDIISFLGGFDLAKAIMVNMGNATVDTWQPKMQMIMPVELEFKAPSRLEIKVANVTVLETGVEAPTVPVLILGLELSLKAYFTWPKKGDFSSAVSEFGSSGALSSGLDIEIEGEIHILIFTISPVIGFYFIGIIGFEVEIDSAEGVKTSFKIAVGAELRINIADIIEAAALIAMGVEHEFESGTNWVLMIFKAEAEILGGIISVSFSIEAKGAQVKELEAGVEKSYAECEVELALDISVAFVIHFEFDTTWQEKRELS